MSRPFIRPDWPAPVSVTALSTLRFGGNSAPPYASLNLADHVADDPDAVGANRVILSALLPVGTDIQWLTQVHGSRVVRAGEEGPRPNADASWSRVPGRACAVLTADCLPVLFCSCSGDRVAAAHAGWRGLLDGVLENTVAATGLEAGKFLAWLGPAIGPNAFEVGEEVRTAFIVAAPRSQRSRTDACFAPNPARADYFHADLYTLARLRLSALGPAGVYGGGFCTLNEQDRFFSYRRDGATGRMASIILLEQPRT